MTLRNRVSSVVRRWPVLHDLLATVSSQCSGPRLQELVVGTRARERQWSNRHRRAGNDWGDTRHRGGPDEWVLGYWDSRVHAHRAFVMEAIAEYSPTSVLEIGCNCGPNLYLAARRFEDARIAGIDINPAAVEKGRELLAAEGITGVELSVGRADDLGRFQDREFDVVLTDAVLLYVGPDRIDRVMREMLRVARRAVVLSEWHWFDRPAHKDPQGLGIVRRGCWQRDYLALLRRYEAPEQVTITRFPQGAWDDRQWQRYGAVVTAGLG